MVSKETLMESNEISEIILQGKNVLCESCENICYNIAIGDNEGDCCRCHGESEACHHCADRYEFEQSLKKMTYQALTKLIDEMNPHLELEVVEKRYVLAMQELKRRQENLAPNTLERAELTYKLIQETENPFEVILNSEIYSNIVICVSKNPDGSLYARFFDLDKSIDDFKVLCDKERMRLYKRSNRENNDVSEGVSQ